MTEYVPTLKEVREGYQSYIISGKSAKEKRAEFDRWLNEIRAEAWDEGRQAEELGWTHAWDGHTAEPDEFCDECKVENPYRNPAE